MTVYNDPSVRFGGEDVGGIRISHLSDIERDIKVSLTSTRGKKAKYEIKRLVSDVAGKLANIAASPTLEALKDSYQSAFKSARTQPERDQLTAAKDKRKAELSAPAAPSARTFAQIADAIKSAASAETAALELDAARSEVTPEQIAELGEVYRRAWGE